MELRNRVPESAQGFLIFRRAKYYSALSFVDLDLHNLGGNTLKTSGLNSLEHSFVIALEPPAQVTFGVSCAK
jgi:hypothetical protein